MTIKYKYNNFNTCIRISKNKNYIEKKIDELKKDYRGSMSIDIDCYSNFIKYSFMLLSIFVLF